MGYQAQQHQHQSSGGGLNDSISNGENGRCIVTPSPSDAMFNGGSNNGGGGNNNGETNFGQRTGIYAGKMGSYGANANGNGYWCGEGATKMVPSHRHSISGSGDEYTVGVIWDGKNGKRWRGWEEFVGKYKCMEDVWGESK